MGGSRTFLGAEDELHEQAARISGLSDFGDGHYLTGLRVLLASIDADARLTERGTRLAWEALLSSLMARASAEQGWKDHPEYRDASLAAPIVIIGLPRTGSTALHKLLAVDPQFQGLEHWLTTAPMPRPPRAMWAGHPLRERAARFLAGVFEGSPQFQAAHNVVVDEYDECIELLRQSFVSNRWACTWTSPGYDAWWQTQDESRSYARYGDLLRLIGCHDPDRRWLLKTPGHIHHLDLLLDVLPDAWIIQTHRHPVKAIASMASTIHNLHRAFEEDGAEISRPLVGIREMEKWAVGIDRSGPIRKTHLNRVIDVHHAEFHAAPLRVIGRLYDFLGLTLTAEVEAAMIERIGDSPERKHGEHRYDLASFGLREGEIVERYRGYIEEFGLGE